jgi:hypothetical protein
MFLGIAIELAKKPKLKDKITEKLFLARELLCHAPSIILL